jgi:hypothetical protein
MDMDVNSFYPSNLCKEIVLTPMDQLTIAINRSWDYWYDNFREIENFTDWVKREGGFEFNRHSMGNRSRITKLHDEQKYTWFMLKWS